MNVGLRFVCLAIGEGRPGRETRITSTWSLGLSAATARIEFPSLGELHLIERLERPGACEPTQRAEWSVTGATTAQSEICMAAPSYERGGPGTVRLSMQVEGGSEFGMQAILDTVSAVSSCGLSRGPEWFISRDVLSTGAYLDMYAAD
jgi:hypothetical protein